MIVAAQFSDRRPCLHLIRSHVGFMYNTTDVRIEQKMIEGSFCIPEIRNSMLILAYRA